MPDTSEIYLNEAPARLDAYSCRVCNAMVVGDIESSHEKVPVDDKLPIGFVYAFSSSPIIHYYVVSYLPGKQELEIAKPELITRDFDDTRYHGYSYNQLSFLDSGGKLVFREASGEDSKEFRRILKDGSYRLLDDGEFDRFRGLFETLDYGGRVKLENLTNKELLELADYKGGVSSENLTNSL